MKKIKQLLTLCLLATSLFASNAQAQQQCMGKVSNIWTAVGGETFLLPVSRGDYVQFCNINTTWKGVTPATCATWIASMRSAVVRRADVNIYYLEPTLCGAIPSYGSAPAPYYMMLIN
jgi:hypothetical protein